MRKFVHLLFAFGIAILSLAGAPANASTTAWLSGSGNDANPCTVAQPCLTFSHTAPTAGVGGEVRCLNGGPYAESGVALNFPITIDCPGTLYNTFNSGFFVLSGDTSVVVKIRNATFDGTQGGSAAILVGGGATMILENCIIQNYNVAGTAIAIQFKPSFPGAQLILTDTVFSNNGIAPSTGGGLQVAPQPGGSAGVVLNRVTFDFNITAMVLNSASGTIGMNMKDSLVTSSRSNGILSQAGSTISFKIERSSLVNNVGMAIQSSGANSLVRIGGSEVTNNQTGLSVAGGGQILSYQNNEINGNGTDGAPTGVLNLK
jgi:hypothetical protein